MNKNEEHNDKTIMRLKISMNIILSYSIWRAYKAKESANKTSSVNDSHTYFPNPRHAPIYTRYPSTFKTSL